tara:strand:+ start:997 stop:2913 length:1917 start_codon:yes stop_codon:yes gene_type:complete
MKKRGQVTVYVILGIVVVAALAGVFLLRSYIIKSDFEREAEKFKVSEDFIPLYNSYRGCINDITLEGVEIMALQGGYIEIPRYEYVVNPLIPFSNKLDVFGNGALEVAYWFYETGNGIQTEKVPTLKGMQQDLGKYVDENLFLCTLNFTSYQGYGINEFENFNANVQIADNKVFVNVLSNFNVDYKEVNQRFDDVKVTVDSSLGYLYNKAVELYNKQKQENYFEEKTIDYLIIYDEIPYSGGSLSCSPRVWSKQNIEKDFKEILEINTDAVGKVNEKYYEIDLDDGKLDLSFSYRKEWPFFMEIDGGENVLKEESAFGENSQAAGFLTALFCLNDYHFIYDVKHPILATLNKNDLDFQFAFEVILDNNQPKENLLGINELPELDTRICDSRNTLLNLFVIDYETEGPLNDVNVKFSCVGSSCDVGDTSFDDFGTYSFSEYVPSCVNADIKTYKGDYHFGKLTLDTNEAVSSFVYMKPYHNLRVNIEVVDNGVLRVPYDNENVFINFINVEDEFNQFLIGDSIDLINGKYLVRSYIMREANTPIKVKGETVEYCTSLPRPGILGALGAKEKKCFTNELEDVELEEVLVGGNEFEWIYDGSGDELTIYVTFDGIPGTVEEMGNVYDRISDQNRVRLPELI